MERNDYKHGLIIFFMRRGSLTLDYTKFILIILLNCIDDFLITWYNIITIKVKVKQMKFFKIDWEVVTEYVKDILRVYYGIDAFCRYEIDKGIVSIYTGGVCIISEEVENFYGIDTSDFEDYIFELIEDFDKGGLE